MGENWEVADVGMAFETMHLLILSQQFSKGDLWNPGSPQIISEYPQVKIISVIILGYYLPFHSVHTESAETVCGGGAGGGFT